MILTDLLQVPVLSADGTRLGVVVDVRFVLDGPPDGLLASPRLHGVIVSPRSRTSLLGYERTDVTRPALIAAFLRWRSRGSFLVLWADLASITGNGVRLRPDATRYTLLLSEAQD